MYVFKTYAHSLKRFLKEEKPYRPQKQYPFSYIPVVFLILAHTFLTLHTEFKMINVEKDLANLANVLVSALNFLAPALNYIVLHIRKLSPERAHVFARC